MGRKDVPAVLAYFLRHFRLPFGLRPSFSLTPTSNRAANCGRLPTFFAAVLSTSIRVGGAGAGLPSLSATATRPPEPAAVVCVASSKVAGAWLAIHSPV